MPNIYLQNDKALIRDGKIAVSENCCCGGSQCTACETGSLPNTVTVTLSGYSAGSCGELFNDQPFVLQRQADSPCVFCSANCLVRVSLTYNGPSVQSAISVFSYVTGVSAELLSDAPIESCSDFDAEFSGDGLTATVEAGGGYTGELPLKLPSTLTLTITCATLTLEQAFEAGRGSVGGFGSNPCSPTLSSGSVSASVTQGNDFFDLSNACSVVGGGSSTPCTPSTSSFWASSTMTHTSDWLMGLTGASCDGNIYKSYNQTLAFLRCIFPSTQCGDPDSIVVADYRCPAGGREGDVAGGISGCDAERIGTSGSPTFDLFATISCSPFELEKIITVNDIFGDPHDIVYTITE